MDRWAGLAAETALLGEDGPDPLAAAQPLDPVLAGADAQGRQFVGDEPVPERRIVQMDVQGGIDQVRVRSELRDSDSFFAWLETPDSL
jgi:hypothetical protein